MIKFSLKNAYICTHIQSQNVEKLKFKGEWCSFAERNSEFSQ